MFADGGVIEPAHLPEEVRCAVDRSLRRVPRYTAPSRQDEELGCIRGALLRAGGNKALAARTLGMSRSTLWAKLHRYGGDLIPSAPSMSTAAPPEGIGCAQQEEPA